jgi:DNA-directed RNA polymerase subunit K/omega
VSVLRIEGGRNTRESDYRLDVLALSVVRRHVESRKTAARVASAAKRVLMVNRPYQMEAFEFVVVSVQRAQQLMRGCVPHLDGAHKATTMAQMEVSAGKVARKVPDPELA